MQRPLPQKWYANLPKALNGFFSEERRRGTLLKTILLSLKHKTLRFAEFETLDSLLRRQAEEGPDRIFLISGGCAHSFREIDGMAESAARWLERMGYAAGDGLALMLENGPEFLSLYLATQRLGMYAVPVNTALVGEGLAHVVGDSLVDGIVLEESLLPVLRKALEGRIGVRDVFVNRDPKARGKRLPRGARDLGEMRSKPSSVRGRPRPSPDAVSTILYTSGTTGPPKGVLYKYGSDWLRKAGLMHRLIHNDDDVLYTCLPLFHANALFLTISAALWLGLPVVLSRKFSASRFWDEVNRHKATVFYAIGAMLPILAKSPPRSDDSRNSVRLVLSAACPASCWREFERRFGVAIWEGYSAVDGGQNFIFNFGNAPAGSLGKMSFSKFRIVDEAGHDVKPLECGELVFKAREGDGVEYFRDEKSTREKTKGGYVRTGDVVYRDEAGYLYFVGRKTESMRRRGENVSAYEIENVVTKRDDVMECAAYGVPSELGEEEIACAVVPVPGREIDPGELSAWLRDKIARHAAPRYIRVMDDLPKTPTHRVVKRSLVEAGVTSDTFDAHFKRGKGST